MRNIIFTTLLSMTLAACARSGDSGPRQSPSPAANQNTSSPSEDSSGTTQSTVTVNGMSPKDYFDQFIYQKKGSCNSDSGVYFQSLSTFHDHILLPEKAANGRIQVGQIALYLQKDGTYVFDYDEWVHSPKEWNSSSYDLIRATRRLGNWKVTPQGTLAIEGIGSGTALKINESPGVLFTMDTDLMSKGVAGQTVTMVRVFSSNGMNSEEVNECLSR